METYSCTNQLTDKEVINIIEVIEVIYLFYKLCSIKKFTAAIQDMFALFTLRKKSS